jgi:hypothetical protein
MSNIYRQSLKGIDEVAFKSAGLPLRLVSYLLVVDGESSVEQLVARHPNLPSMQAVLQGLQGQGFIEVVGTSANVVDIAQMRVGNGQSVNVPMPPPQQQPVYAAAPQPAPAYRPSGEFFPELENYKATMIRDVTALLGADSAPVASKIQGCKTRDDLFSTMMGIKKIITIYTNRDTAEKFGTRYASLSN